MQTALVAQDHPEVQIHARDAGGATVAATVAPGSAANQYMLDPSADLAAGAQYTVTLTGGSSAIRDSAGNPLATTGWSFTPPDRPRAARRWAPRPPCDI